MEADEWQEDWSFFVTALYKVTEKIHLHARQWWKERTNSVESHDIETGIGNRPC